MKQRPGGLTAICVITLVVGALGVLSGISQFVNLLIGQKLQAAVLQAQAGAGEAALQAQREMQAKMAAITQKYAVYHWVCATTQSILAWIMIVGAVLSLRLRPAGRTLLLVALVASLLFEPAKAVLTAAVTKQSAPVIVASMKAAAQNSAPPGSRQSEEIGQMMGGLSQLVVVMQWVVLIGMTALWCIFYLVGVWYLTKPAVRALFAPDVRSETDASGDPQLR